MAMFTASQTDRASLHSPSTCFQRASEKFATSLTDKQRRDFTNCSLKDVHQTVNTLQEKREDNKKLRNMARLQAFLEAMDQYRKVVETFLNCTPFLGYIWGPIRFILLVTNTWIESLDIVLDAYQEIGERLASFMRYQRLFGENAAMRGVLELYFCDIVEFHYHALKFVDRPGWKRLFQSSWKTFNTQFRRILESLARHKELIESEKGTVTLSEIQSLHVFTKLQFEEIVSREQTKQLSVILEKLNAPRYRLDQCAASDQRRGRSSGSWVLLDEKFQKWADITADENPLLYIHGIPGAGKTILASYMIEKLQERQSAPVVFFYCKHGESDKDSFNSILRALVAQLLYEDHALISSLYNICSSKDQAGVTMVLEELAEMAFESKETSFVVLDGLDECLPKEAEKTLSWFQSHLKNRGKADSGHIRLLCVGQRVEVLQRELSSAADITLDQNTSHLEDVERYVKGQADALKVDFELSSQDETEIVTRVVGGAKSMFLFAKLVMENLGNQTSQNDLRKELEPTTFPVDLGQAYARVVSNVFKEGPQRTAATNIISWVACAKRPLKWREVQAIFFIDPKTSISDFKGRKLRRSCKKLCSSLIDLQSADREPQTEAVLSLVHDTARDFLVRKALINVSLQHAKMALFCTEYLLSTPFDYTIQADQLNNHVRSGYYALQDYALSHWLDHMTHSLRAEGLPDTSVDIHHDLVRQLRSFVEEYAGSKKRHYFRGIEEDGDLLDIIPKDISSWSQWFDLEWRTFRVRGAIESLGNGSTSDNTDRDMMREIYGTRLFKCSRLACNRFTTGFDSKTERDDHVNEHDRPFHCLEQFCPYHTLGFRTETELESHLTHNHPEDDGDEFSFPEPPTKRKWDSIFKACARGDIVAVKSFLDSGEDVNKPTRPKGRETPLYVAAENGRLNVCRLLLDRGADINHQGKITHAKSMAFGAAVSSGHLEIVQYFLERSEVLSDQTFSRLLHLAIRSKSEAVFHALLESKIIDLNAQHSVQRRSPKYHPENWTPLMLAAETGQERIVKTLLATDGVDLNLKDDLDQTALALAVLKNEEAVVRILLANENIDPNRAGRDGLTPLEWAVKRGQETIIKLLLATDKVISNGTDVNGRTPFCQAAEQGHEAIVKLFLATDKIDPEISDANGRTPLSWAAEQGHEAIVELLLATDRIDPEISDENDRTPLSWAAEQGHEAIVELLLATDKVDLEKSDKSGRTPTIWAAQEGHKMAVKLLLAKDMFGPDAKDRNGRATLFRALTYQRWAFSYPQTFAAKRRAIVDVLLSTGQVDIDARDDTDETLLMYVASFGDKESTQLLLDVGANPHLQDLKGQTALDKAAENGHEEVAELLRAAFLIAIGLA